VYTRLLTVDFFVKIQEVTQLIYIRNIFTSFSEQKYKKTKQIKIQ